MQANSTATKRYKCQGPSTFSSFCFADGQHWDSNLDTLTEFLHNKLTRATEQRWDGRAMLAQVNDNILSVKIYINIH
jgi:hypothetical protein